jgi:hypothetical protein
MLCLLVIQSGTNGTINDRACKYSYIGASKSIISSVTRCIKYIEKEVTRRDYYICSYCNLPPNPPHYHAPPLHSTLLHIDLLDNDNSWYEMHLKPSVWHYILYQKMYALVLNLKIHSIMMVTYLNMLNHD